MVPHSSTLAWKIPWTEKPGGLQTTGSLKIRHDWATSLSLFTFMHWRMKWQPTPVFLPGESQRREPGGLPSMGSHRVGHDWNELAAAAAATYIWWQLQSVGCFCLKNKCLLWSLLCVCCRPFRLSLASGSSSFKLKGNLEAGKVMGFFRPSQHCTWICRVSLSPMYLYWSYLNNIK